MVGPFYDTVQGEGELITKEEEIATAENNRSEIVAEVVGGNNTENSVEVAETNPILTKEEIMQLKVSELREHLKAKK